MGRRCELLVVRIYGPYSCASTTTAVQLEGQYSAAYQRLTDDLDDQFGTLGASVMYGGWARLLQGDVDLNVFIPLDTSRPSW